LTDLFSLAGRVAVVTGGAGQLGGEIARGLAARGAKVAIFDIAKAAEGDGVSSFVVDVTDRGAVERATTELSDVPHILVNAAALDSPPDAPAEEVGPFEDYPSESFDEVMQVNVKGTLLACQVIGGRVGRRVECRGVHEDVRNAGELRRCPFDCAAIRDVDDEAADAVALRSHGNVEDRHLRAARRQPTRDLAAELAGAAGDDGDSTVEREKVVH
jgi:NAD(P)-dependent dehydrogenase (short-subunit alcohol dehydrogenase family)